MSEEEKIHRIMIRPNRSLSREGMVVAFVLVTAVVMTIAIVFALMGAWMVLPFAGMEALLFGGIFYWFYRHYDDCEYVLIEDNRVRILRRQGSLETDYEFERSWLRVTLEDNDRRGRPQRAYLSSRGKRIEIAKDLNQDEKLEFVWHLRSALQLHHG
jgi:uncharacterized membrane protein